MRLVNKPLLEDFKRKHADARSQIDAWICEVEDAQWSGPHDIKSRFPTASFMADNRVVFNLKGNSYRLDVNVAYGNEIVIVKRIGTHTQYDRWTF